MTGERERERGRKKGRGKAIAQKDTAVFISPSCKSNGHFYFILIE